MSTKQPAQEGIIMSTEQPESPEELRFEDEQSIISTGEKAITNPQEVDWAALWEEFGFDTPNAIGSIVISKTQLTGAIESSDQNISLSTDDAIDWATEHDILLKKEIRGWEGEMQLRGFILKEMLA